MAAANFELNEGFILEKDIYKDKTLLLRRGVILNAYLLNKLSNFGIHLEDLYSDVENSDKSSYTDKVENEKILILNEDELAAKRMKILFKYFGYTDKNVACIKNITDVTMKNTNVSYIFVPSYLYNDDLISKLVLSNNANKINVFVLDCNLKQPDRVFFNTDFLNVKFLYRPLSKEYIQILFKIYP